MCAFSCFPQAKICLEECVNTLKPQGIKRPSKHLKEQLMFGSEGLGTSLFTTVAVIAQPFHKPLMCHHNYPLTLREKNQLYPPPPILSFPY